eukprot:2044480-Pleurochrysis_carterae.AAC.1
MRTRGALALRSSSSWITRSRWPPLPRRATFLEPPVGATQPPRLRLLPAPDGCIYIFPSAPAQPG